MDDLRVAEDRVLEAVVKPMNKNQHMFAWRLPQQALEAAERFCSGLIFGFEGHEIGCRIARDFAAAELPQFGVGCRGGMETTISAKSSVGLPR